jgi:hypothetical protein
LNELHFHLAEMAVVFAQTVGKCKVLEGGKQIGRRQMIRKCKNE